MATTIVDTPSDAALHTGWNFRRNWTFLVPAILLSLMMLGSGVMYFLNAGEVNAEFTKLGFPTWVRPILAVAKIAGVLAIWFSPSPALRHMAYAGFLIDFVLAALAHGYAGDGHLLTPFIALTLLGLTMWRDPRG